MAFILSAAIHAAPQTLDKVLAVVNDTPITENQITEQVDLLKKQMQAQNIQFPSDDSLRRQALEQMINETLLLQRAKETGIIVSDEELNSAIAKIAVENNMTVEDLHSNITAAGIPFEDYRNKVKEGLIIHNLQQRDVASAITVTQQEIKDYLQSPSLHNQTADEAEYRLRDILVKLPENASQKQMEKSKAIATSLVQSLKSGKSAKTLIAPLSDAVQEDVLNWRKRTDLPELFLKYIPSMAIGEVQGPIEAPNGIHIIQLINKRGGTAKNPTENDARNNIFKRKVEEALEGWLKQLKDAAYIKMY